MGAFDKSNSVYISSLYLLAITWWGKLICKFVGVWYTKCLCAVCHTLLSALPTYITSFLLLARCVLVLLLFSIPIFLHSKFSSPPLFDVYMNKKYFFLRSFEWLMNGHFYRFHFKKLNDIFIQLNEKVFIHPQKGKNQWSLNAKYDTLSIRTVFFSLSPSPIIYAKSITESLTIGFCWEYIWINYVVF